MGCNPNGMNIFSNPGGTKKIKGVMANQVTNPILCLFGGFGTGISGTVNQYSRPVSCFQVDSFSVNEPNFFKYS